jgi:hypothetical protein
MKPMAAMISSRKGIAANITLKAIPPARKKMSSCPALW